MGFLINGNFGGYLCGNCREPLGNVLVKIYVPNEIDTNTDKQDAINSKYALEVLDTEAVTSKKNLLLGEGKTDTEGNYEIELDEEYELGPVTIDIEILQVPHQNRPAEPTVQFTITTLQPVWRPKGDGWFAYSWNYCLPYTFWSGIRSMFDAWVVCGHVKSVVDRKTPVEGVKVFAYDADWVKDDLIGMAITDPSGHFRVYYESRDFKQTFLTPLVNVETPFSTIPGPDLYFKVSSIEGAMLYEEVKSDGQIDERKHAPKCFYIELFVAPA